MVVNFKDVEENDWFYPYVNAVYKEKIVSGLGNQFNPKDKATREMAVVVCINALKFKDNVAKN
ncbi:MAG: S-layer homology domain-containing protein [Marinisporobacter sp.]|jgi:hypothetical protein|nr:S-layer homology domain-containing protein [Marinisporobacter sp.]